MNECLHAWVWTLQDAFPAASGSPHTCLGLSVCGAPVIVPHRLSLSAGPAHFPPSDVGVLDSDSCPFPQTPEPELSWSWGPRLRTVQDRAGAMAPPPLSPLATSTPLLHGEFGSYPARGPRFALTLTPQALHIQRLRPKPEARPRGGLVLLAEVSGCCTLRSRSPSDPAAYLCIYTYPRGRRGGRRRATRTFGADGAATYEENRAEVQRWATVLTCLLRGLQLPGNGGEVPGKLGVSAHLPLRASLSAFLCVCGMSVSLSWKCYQTGIGYRRNKSTGRGKLFVSAALSLGFVSSFPFHGSRPRVSQRLPGR